MKLESFLLSGLLLLASAAYAYADDPHQISLTYLDTDDTEEQATQESLQHTAELADIIDMVHDELILKHPVKIRFGTEDGPLFDPETQQINIPYQFITDTIDSFKSVDYQDSGLDAKEAAYDVLFYTLLHELGHVFIAMYELPIVGNEEDAADSLATMMLIENFDEGAEIAISAADLFNIESIHSDEINDEESYWDEHKLDIQRANATLCLVYGSDTEKYAYIATENDFDGERKARCSEEYQLLTQGWEILLGPHFKPPSEPMPSNHSKSL